MDQTLGSTNAAIIADNPSNRASGSTINVGQSTVFETTGLTGSFVFLISQNNSAENGGSNTAITISQSSVVVVAYASHGKVTLGQSATVKSLVAHQISLSQTSNVTYDPNLPSTIFHSDSTSNWDILGWKEVQ
jgi:hypothetical protein